MKPTNPRAILAIGISIIMLVVIVAALFLAGSPKKARSAQFDSQRRSHLEQITYAVSVYVMKEKVLPPSLGAMQAQPGYYIDSFADPVSGEPYEYRPKPETLTYELCATFELSSVEANDTRLPPQPKFPQKNGEVVVPPSFWAHEAGHHCYTFTAPVEDPAMPYKR